MTITIYVLSFLLTLASYRWMHNWDFSQSRRTVILFFLLFSFCSFLYKPFFDAWVWAGLLVLFYTALDDFLNKSFNILPLLLVYIYFNILNFTTINLFFSLSVFTAVFLLSRKGWVGEGDAYAIAVFILLVGAEDTLAFLYLSSLIGAISFLLLSFSRTPEKEQPFFPILLLSCFIIHTDHHSLRVMAGLTLLFSILFLVSSIKKRAGDRKKKT
jgi:hypothetical protein